jgi:hypothetical protein
MSPASTAVLKSSVMVANWDMSVVVSSSPSIHFCRTLEWIFPLSLGSASYAMKNVPPPASALATTRGSITSYTPCPCLHA